MLLKKNSLIILSSIKELVSTWKGEMVITILFVKKRR